jgi:hypothetical protein
MNVLRTCSKSHADAFTKQKDVMHPPHICSGSEQNGGSPSRCAAHPIPYVAGYSYVSSCWVVTKSRPASSRTPSCCSVRHSQRGVQEQPPAPSTYPPARTTSVTPDAESSVPAQSICPDAYVETSTGAHASAVPEAKSNHRMGAARRRSSFVVSSIENGMRLGSMQTHTHTHTRSLLHSWAFPKNKEGRVGRSFVFASKRGTQRTGASAESQLVCKTAEANAPRGSLCPQDHTFVPPHRSSRAHVRTPHDPLNEERCGAGGQKKVVTLPPRGPSSTGSTKAPRATWDAQCPRRRRGRTRTADVTTADPLLLR